MRYLENFINYLNESVEDVTDLTKEELNDLLIPITDLGVEYSFTSPKVITDGEFYGHRSLSIQFKNSFKTIVSSGVTEEIVDDRFWIFLDELISLKNRLESARVSININSRHHIVITFIQKAKVEGDLLTIQKLYNDMTEKTNIGKSDFCYGLTKKLYADELKIVVNCSSFTENKWNHLFRGINFSNFNVNKEITSTLDSSRMNTAVITITL